MNEYTMPPQEEIQQMAMQVPQYMHRNMMPSVVIQEEALTSTQCDHIVEEMERYEPYSFKGCGATTREYVHVDVPTKSPLRPVEDILDDINARHFHFSLRGKGASWMQTYGAGDEYPLHCDDRPGTSRKLTALVMLTDEHEYTGGTLWFFFGQLWVSAPRTRGTIFVYPGWMMHKVDPVGSGVRKTLNMGVWGPPFK